MKNWVSAAVVLAAALQLAACDSAKEGPKSMEEAKEEASKLERPRPGQYKQTMTITQFELPGAPPEMAAQLKTALGQSQVQEFCLTEQMSEQGYKDMFQKVGEGGECSYDRFNVSGGKLDAALQCQSEAEGKAQFTLAGSVTPEGSDIKMNIDTDNPKSPMGKSKIGMHLTTQRVGDCPAAK